MGVLPPRTILYAHDKTIDGFRDKFRLVLQYASFHCDQSWLRDGRTVTEPLDKTIKLIESYNGVNHDGVLEGKPGNGDKVSICFDIDGSTDGLERCLEISEEQPLSVDLVLPSLGHIVDPLGIEQISQFFSFGVRVHDAQHGVALSENPYVSLDDPSMQRVLSGLCDSITHPERGHPDSDPNSDKDGIPYHGGRPPTGYKITDNGDRLVADLDGDTGPEYETVCDVLHKVSESDMSVRSAAKRLDCSRATVNNCIEERPDMYRLD